MKKMQSENSGQGVSRTDIEKIREEIDAIDSRLLKLINQRLALADRIGRIKAQNGNPVLDRNREDRLLERLSAENQGPLSKRSLRHVFMEIISAAREIQGLKE